MTQEIIAVDSEADVGTRWEVIHSVKGKFTKSNLKTVHREKASFIQLSWKQIPVQDMVFLSYSQIGWHGAVRQLSHVVLQTTAIGLQAQDLDTDSWLVGH